MAQNYGPRIITDGLVAHFDAKLKSCYPGAGTIMKNLGAIDADFTLNGATVDSNGDILLAGQGETDGSPAGDNISVSATTNVQNYDEGVTYEIWINPDIAGRRALFFGAATINHLEIYGNAPTVRTEAKNQNGYSFGASLTGTDGFTVGKWTLLTIVFSPDDATRPVYWYIDGVLAYTHANFYSGTSGSGEDFSFSAIGKATGNSSYAYAKSFSGKLNCFKMYSRALSGSEVSQNFKTTKGRFGL